MADYLIKGETLTNIADAIRSKTGSTEDIKAKDMASTIETISTGTDTSDATATADEIFAGETAYTADGKVIGTFTIENELTEQDNLIAQIQSAVDNLPEIGGGESGSGSALPFETCTVTIQTDERSSKLGVKVIDGLPVPIYQEDSSESLTWEAPCGSIVAVGYPLTDNHICDSATYLGHDDGTYVLSSCMGCLEPVHIFRIDAKAGETAYIQMYEFEPF